MRSTSPQTVLASLLTCLAFSACDPVRPGGFYGDYPGPVRVDLARAPEMAALAAQPGWHLSLGVKTWRYRPAREWSYLNVNGVGIISTEPSAPASGEAYAWPWLALALDVGTRWYDPQYLGPSLAVGVVEISAWPPFSSDPSSDTVEPPLVAADDNHVLVVAIDDMDVALIGPSGPIVHVPRGFHMFQRTCTPDGQQSFTEVPLDTVVHPVTVGWLSPLASEAKDLSAARCGGTMAPTIDLGAVASAIPLTPLLRAGTTYTTDSPLVIDALAWPPSADGIYFVARESDYWKDYTPDPYAQVGHLVLGASGPNVVTTGQLAAPLAVATGGTSLLFWVSRGETWQYVRQSLVTDLLPLQAPLPSGAYLSPFASADNVLSPDGSLLASRGLLFTDLRGLGTTPLDLALPSLPTNEYEVVPRAFAPGGDIVLVESWRWDDPAHRSFGLVPLAYAGALPATLGALVPLPTVGMPAALVSGSGAYFVLNTDTSVRYFWSASGPQALIQDAEGTRVYDFITQQSSLLVEPGRVAPAAAPMDVVAATNEVFAWAMHCFGLAETSCQAELRRLSLTTGAIDVVARADRPLVFAVSPDGTKLAIADDTNIYLKTIVP